MNDFEIGAAAARSDLAAHAPYGNALAKATDAQLEDSRINALAYAEGYKNGLRISKQAVADAKAYATCDLTGIKMIIQEFLATDESTFTNEVRARRAGMVDGLSKGLDA